MSNTRWHKEQGRSVYRADIGGWVIVRETVREHQSVPGKQWELINHTTNRYYHGSFETLREAQEAVWQGKV